MDMDLGMGMGLGIGFLAVVGIIMLVFAVLGIVAYVLKSIGLYVIAGRRGIQNNFLAWIPVGNSYILGKIADDINVRNNTSSNYSIILVILNAVVFLKGAWAFRIGKLIYSIFITGSAENLANFHWGVLPIATGAVSIAFFVLTIIAYYIIFKDYSYQNHVVFTVLTAIFGLDWLFVFIIRNNQSGNNFRQY